MMRPNRREKGRKEGRRGSERERARAVAGVALCALGDDVKANAEKYR